METNNLYFLNFYSMMLFFEKKEYLANLTDFAKLLGGKEFDAKGHNIEVIDNEKQYGYFWCLNDYNGDGEFPIFGPSCYVGNESIRKRFIGSRPALNLSEIKEDFKITKMDGLTIEEIEYGEYPKTVVSEDLEQILEGLYNSNSLVLTGKTYTVDKTPFDDEIKPFEELKLCEYLYNNKKYVRVKCNNDKGTFSNGRILENGRYYFVEVEPLKWNVDVKYNFLITKDIVFSGIQFDNKNFNKDFLFSNIKNYMDTYFSKNIIPSKNYIKSVNLDEELTMNLDLCGKTSELIPLLEDIKKNIKVEVKNIVRKR